MRASSTQQRPDSAKTPVDLAILLQLPRAAAIAELRRFQALCPSFDAAVRALVLDVRSVALLVAPSEAGPLRAFLRAHPAHRGVCRWTRPSPRRAPIVANAQSAAAGSPIQSWRRERDGAAPATVGTGSATRHAEEACEVAAGPGWRHLRRLPTRPARPRRIGMPLALSTPRRRKTIGSE